MPLAIYEPRMGLSESMQEDDFNVDDDEEDVRASLYTLLSTVVACSCVTLCCCVADFVAASILCVRALENHSGFGFVSSELRRTPR